jgi:hypothetical protein
VDQAWLADVGMSLGHVPRSRWLLPDGRGIPHSKPSGGRTGNDGGQATRERPAAPSRRHQNRPR